MVWQSYSFLLCLSCWANKLSYGCLFMECTAKTKLNIEQCESQSECKAGFEELVRKVCFDFQLLFPLAIWHGLFLVTYWAF
jgi:hypothetical protein